MSSYQSVLDYWFGNEPEDAQTISKKSGLWWGKVKSIDEEISSQFGGLFEKLKEGQLHNWKASPSGRLALIILADQFSRNIFRDTPDAFAHDKIARDLCHEGLKEKADNSLRVVERVFFYIPLEHSEKLSDQDLCVELFERLLLKCPEGTEKQFENYLEFANRHRDIIKRFGRFPHRNAILDRQSTKAEQEFLERPGSSF